MLPDWDVPTSARLRPPAPNQRSMSWLRKARNCSTCGLKGW